MWRATFGRFTSSHGHGAMPARHKPVLVGAKGRRLTASRDVPAPLLATPATRLAGITFLNIALATAAGCDAGSGGSAVSTSASETGSAVMNATAATSTAAEPASPPPSDLDVGALQKALSCAVNAKSGPCSVLAAFGSCKPWSASAPSGDGRWIGRGFEVEGKKTTEQVSVMRLRKVPTTEVGPGQLPGRIALGVIDKDEGSPFGEADKAIRALERGDVPPKGSAAISHLKSMAQWSEAFILRTAGGQVFGLSHGGLFVCEGSKRELYVVRKASTRTSVGDGTYATLWAALW